MDKKIIAYIIIGVLLLILILSTFNIINLNFKKSNSNGSENYANLPEKCRLPAGQDIEAWKEHLGHHAETQDCLEYFIK